MVRTNQVGEVWLNYEGPGSLIEKRDFEFPDRLLIMEQRFCRLTSRILDIFSY